MHKIILEILFRYLFFLFINLIIFQGTKYTFVYLDSLEIRKLQVLKSIYDNINITFNDISEGKSSTSTSGDNN